MSASIGIPLTGLLCPLLFIGFFVGVIILILRLLRAARNSVGSRISAPPSANVPTRVADDGFWIDSCSVDPGSMIFYHYWSGGARYSGQVPFQPAGDGRQFVYTGRRPEQVSIARIIGVDDDDYSSGSSIIPPIIASAATWDPPDPPTTPSDPPSSAPSFPSAY